MIEAQTEALRLLTLDTLESAADEIAHGADPVRVVETITARLRALVQAADDGSLFVLPIKPHDGDSFDDATAANEEEP